MTIRQRLRDFADIGMDVVAVIFIGGLSLLILAAGIAGFVYAVKYATGTL